MSKSGLCSRSDHLGVHGGRPSRTAAGGRHEPGTRDFVSVDDGPDFAREANVLPERLRDSEDDTKRGREPRLRDFARRLLADDEDGGISPREVLGAVIEGGDKPKPVLVRMVAREVRTYLEGLGLHEDVRHLMTNYSLDVSASFRLRPLSDEVGQPSEE